ncbi:MAG: phosphoglucosamine mutase [Deltaproteobacteria bacterium]|nr:phosphoglucosamine mutase [Deltaproteobacteria bacterium]
MVARQLFGTDGVRGRANVYPMTSDLALHLGQAVAGYFSAGGKTGRIIIGKDTRRSCYMFEMAMASGIMSMGADVMLVGPLPTPAIAHITSSMRADAGVVISASHNPYEDNGIKIFGADGFKLPDEAEREIEEMVLSGELDHMLPESDMVGRARRIDDAGGRYVAFCKNTFPSDLTLDGLRIVIDCANGATYKVAPAVFEELGAEVFSLGVDPDGKNINYRSGALHPESLCAAVTMYRADLGIALDGDGDRMILSDEKGQVVDGDEVMAIAATRLIAARRLKYDTVVSTVMSNIGLEKALEKAGGRLVRTRVGDRYVVEEMRQSGYNFGGEQSGHLIYLDYTTTGDGIVAALQLLAVMIREGKPLSELRQVMTRYPQVLVNVPVANKPPLEEIEEVQKAFAMAKERLKGEGRIVARYSGTEMKARVMVEGANEREAHQLADELGEVVKKACS